MSFPRYFFRIISKQRIIIFLSALIAFAVLSLLSSRPVEVDMLVELSPPHGVAVFFCAEKDVRFSAKDSLSFNYSKEINAGENEYRFTGVLPCKPTFQKLRFDPTWAEGQAIVKEFRVRQFHWNSVDLLKEFNKSMRIINAVDLFEYKEDGLHIVSTSKDPHVLLTENIQRLLVINPILLLCYFALIMLASALTLAITFHLYRVCVNDQTTIERYRAAAANHSGQIIGNLFEWFRKKRVVNIYAVGLAFAIASWGNFVFIENIYGAFSFASAMAFLNSEVQLILVPLASYLLLCAISARRELIQSLLSAGLIVASVVYLADAYLFRLNGMHVAHGFSMLLDGGLSNYSKNIKFTKLSDTVLIAYQLCVLTIIVASVFLSRYFSRLSAQAKISVSITRYASISLLGLLFLYFEQMVFSEYKEPRIYRLEQQNLPLYLTFYEAGDHILTYKIQLSSLQNTSAPTAVNFEKNDTSRRKNIYLFILESVREDILNVGVSPNIVNFRDAATTFNKAIANGNATHYGWYSIVNSRTPLFWEEYRNKPTVDGSDSLSAFKEAGYSINIHTAKDLTYLQSSRVMFGSGEPLYDYISEHPDVTPSEHDRRVMDHLISSSLAQDPADVSFNIVFLDSTHFPYRWGEELAGPFEPYAGNSEGGVFLNEARALALYDRDKLLNRYRNSIKYTDMLFGEFVTALKDNGLYDDAIIVLVGDHGQQFMEHNFLMHGMTLYAEDLRIPLYLSVPGLEKGRLDTVASQMDIMPTLLDYSGIRGETTPLSDGHSLLSASPKQFGVSFAAGMQNTPYSFVVENSRWKVFGELEKRDPKKSETLKIVRILTSDDVEHVPGSGAEVDYRAFLNEDFYDYFQSMSFVKRVN